MSLFGDILRFGGDVLGMESSRKSSSKNIDAQIAWQRELAERGISMKVDDARRAGLHPLAVLGANTMSPTPISVMDDRRGDYISRMGQGLGRIFDYFSKDQKSLRALGLKKSAEELESIKLDNEIKRKNLNAQPLQAGAGNVGLTATGATMLNDGQIQGATIIPQEIKHSTNLGLESGVKPLEFVNVDENGFLMKLPPMEQAMGLQSSFIDRLHYTGQKFWNELKAQYKSLSPKFTKKFASEMRKERAKLPKVKGKHWVWNVRRSTWRLIEDRGKKYFYDGGLYKVPYNSGASGSF